MAERLPLRESPAGDSGAAPALLAGAILALPLVPGPGIPLMLVGLVLLSSHFTWAKRCLDWAKLKWHRLRPD